MAYASESSSCMPTVITGEDFESDEEISQEMFNNSYKQGKAPVLPHGIVISGEASESDEELDSRQASDLQPSGSDYSLSESWGRPSVDGAERMESPKDDERLKYNTLLHRKLRERNQSLRKNLIEIACQPYQSASKEIHSISQQLIKSQLLVQEVSSTLRRLTNELFVLEDRVNCIRSGSFLPDIDLSSVPPVETP